MKKTKIIIPFLLLCTIISAYYFSNNNSCMRKAPHYDSFIYFNQPVGQFEMSQNIADESIDEKKYKRFKRTEDGMKALFRINLMEWKDGRFYYQLHHRNSYHEPSTMTFLANSSRVNVSSVPVWVNGIK